MEKKRVMLILTDDMHDALRRQAARRGATLSGLCRAVLGSWLEEQGEEVDWLVQWGGQREGAGTSRKSEGPVAPPV